MDTAMHTQKTTRNGKRNGRTTAEEVDQLFPPGLPPKRKPGRPSKRQLALEQYQQLKTPLQPGEKITTKLEIPALNIEVMQIELQGVTPLICHRFDEKVRGQMEDKQQGRAVHKKAPKDPKAEYERCFYRNSSGKYGFPASAFKGAAVSACRFVEGISMTHAKGAFHVLGDVLEIKGSKPTMRTDVCRVGPFGKKVADIRYRPEFDKWAVILTVRYNASVITPSQIANLLNVAGFAIGVGEWRPEKSGSFGQFQVAEQGGRRGRRS